MEFSLKTITKVEMKGNYVKGQIASILSVSLPQELRYQNVRIIAVYETDPIPALQG
jgi:hypothetical protein